MIILSCGGNRWLGEFELDEKTFDSEAMAMIRQKSGINLPIEVRGLNFRYSPPIDPSFVARLEVPVELRDHIHKQIESIVDEDLHISGGPGEKVSWWPPPGSLVIIDRQHNTPDGSYFRAALTHEGNRIILYLQHAVF
jgi:hypothetical protein